MTPTYNTVSIQDSSAASIVLLLLLLNHLPLDIAGVRGYTDKKENQIFLIYKDIQNGAVAKSYITNSLLIELTASSYIRKPFLIYDFATAPL